MFHDTENNEVDDCIHSNTKLKFKTDQIKYIILESVGFQFQYTY